MSALKALYSSDEAAKLILDEFAGRERGQRETKVDRLQGILSSDGVGRSEIIRVFRILEELGFGEFIEGRRGHVSRFQWQYSAVDVGKAASGSSDAIGEIGSAEEDDEDAELSAARIPPGSLAHRFQLRPDWQVDVILPVNFSTQEAARLSDFIKTLPFNSGPI